MLAILPSLPGNVMVIESPCKVSAVVSPGLVKSEEVTFPPTTWYKSTCVNASSSGIAGNALKASFVGANTVNGPSPSKVLTKSVAGVNSVKAVTSVAKLGSAAANVTTVGIPITASTMWIVPLVASISAWVTVETPLKVTPSEVLKYKLIALLLGPVAKVLV